MRERSGGRERFSCVASYSAVSLLHRFEEDQMNRVARRRTKRSGRGVNDSLTEVTDFSGLDTLLDNNVRCISKLGV